MTSPWGSSRTLTPSLLSLNANASCHAFRGRRAVTSSLTVPATGPAIVSNATKTTPKVSASFIPPT
jgi:hypothetical protein